MLISPTEIFYLLIVTAVIGYIFMNFIPRAYNPYVLRKRFDWNNFKLACLLVAPGIVFHELAHKFVAMSFGLSAAFQIWPFGLILGAFLKAIGSSFILLAPGWVGISSGTTLLQSVLIAFSGPFINLTLWLVSWIILNRAKLTRKQAVFLYLLKQVNMWLFIFNMLPIPPLDGSKVFYGLFKIIFG
ncbi:MAG: M50 family metallopeptidase [Nanoarchaeota archaeon]